MRAAGSSPCPSRACGTCSSDYRRELELLGAERDARGRHERGARRRERRGVPRRGRVVVRLRDAAALRRRGGCTDAARRRAARAGHGRRRRRRWLDGTDHRELSPEHGHRLRPTDRAPRRRLGRGRGRDPVVPARTGGRTTARGRRHHRRTGGPSTPSRSPASPRCSSGSATPPTPSAAHGCCSQTAAT